ncbi:MAG: DUF1292 domain-containing protein [Peptoniphilus sp.]|nr:DUF1292 domain-containing protein [Peptoniphilus sp.]MDD7363736.1 DUF1292 domain-containing protein [Bacillota bacterium]MDY6044121.1 DUF1292 domain-containing protein [Peptoniphilus sp.]
MSHEHEHDHEHEHEAFDVITLTLEDDSEMDCAVIGIFPFEEKQYVALMPIADGEIDEDASVLLYEYNEVDDVDIELGFIEDEDYFNKVAEEFERLFVEENIEE